MNIVPRKIESRDTWQICKMGIHGLKKLLLTISMNLSQKKIQAMISHQHQNVAVDVDGVDEVAEEEERINIKQTSHPKESNLKLYPNALYHPINLKLYPQDNRLKMCSNALYHPINLKLYLQDNRLKMCWNALYHPNQPQAQAQTPPTTPQSAPVPPVFPISNNVSLAVGQSGQHTNAQLLYGPLVPQNDEDCLLCGRQPIIVMYNHMIQKCYTCDVRYDLNFMCPPHNMVICSKTRRSMIINGHKI